MCPDLPCSHSAPRTAPRAKPRRERASCRNLEHVVLAAGGDNVLAVGVAHPVRGDGNLDAGADSLDDFLERESRCLKGHRASKCDAFR